MAKTEKIVKINNDFELVLNSAIRYGLGQKSFITKTISNYAISVIDKIDIIALHTIILDIERAIEQDNLGAEEDRCNWLNLYKCAQKELDNRHKK